MRRAAPLPQTARLPQATLDITAADLSQSSQTKGRGVTVQHSVTVRADRHQVNKRVNFPSSVIARELSRVMYLDERFAEFSVASLEREATCLTDQPEVLDADAARLPIAFPGDDLAPGNGTLVEVVDHRLSVRNGPGGGSPRWFCRQTCPGQRSCESGPHSKAELLGSINRRGRPTGDCREFDTGIGQTEFATHPSCELSVEAIRVPLTDASCTT